MLGNSHLMTRPKSPAAARYNHPVYGQSFGLLLLSKKWPAAEEEKGCTEVFYGTDK